MMKSLKTTALLMGLCLSINAVVFTQSASAASNLTPDMLVRQTADKVLAKVQANKQELENDTSKIFALVEDYVLPHFNFTKMSRSVLGKHWHRAKPAEQKSFIRQFQMLLVRTYAVALLNYSNQAIQYLPFRMKEDAKVAVVKTRVTDGNSPPLPIDYLLHRPKEGEWKVVDVKIDGISLVSNYRTSFSQQIRREGVTGLIKQLEARNDYLAQESGVRENEKTADTRQPAKEEAKKSKEETVSAPAPKEQTAKEAVSAPAPEVQTAEETVSAPAPEEQMAEAAKPAAVEPVETAQEAPKADKVAPVVTEQPKKETAPVVSAKVEAKPKAATTTKTAAKVVKKEPDKAVAVKKKSAAKTTAKKITASTKAPAAKGSNKTAEVRKTAAKNAKTSEKTADGTQEALGDAVAEEATQPAPKKQKSPGFLEL